MIMIIIKITVLTTTMVISIAKRVIIFLKEL